MISNSKTQVLVESQVKKIKELQTKNYETPYLIRYSKTIKDKENVIISAIRCGGYCGQCSAHYYEGATD